MKKIIALLLALVMALSLVACGGSAEAPAAQAPAAEAPAAEGPQAITLKVWAPQADQVDENSWLSVMLPKFEEAHPEYTITWDIGVCGEGDAAGIVKNDPSAAADIFLYANDQMGTLIEAGALAKLGGSYLEQVQNDVAQTYVDTVTYTDGGVYGFPMAPNTWFMWYNKDVFTEEDVKSLNTMLEKGVIAFPMNNSWYTSTFFFGVGGTVFGPQGIDAAAGIDFSSDLCVEAAKFMVEFANHPNFINDADGVGVAGMKDGTISAMFSGPWDRPALEESLGDKLGCVVLPKFTLNGTEYQMKSFAGSKAIGVNPNAKFPKAAMQLAAFLASPEGQLARYELSAITPAATACAENEAVKANFVVVTESAEMAQATIAQPTIAQMGAYWDPVKAFGDGILNGDVTVENAAEKLAATMELLNSSGL
nr:extracellular solute-binding protein [Oscillospiraceae bacterium]